MFVFCSFVVAGFVRFWLLNSESAELMSNRVELSTPLNSWKRLTEGVYLYNEGIDPYQGDMFHESPLMLVLFHKIIYKIPSFLPLIFTLSDLITAMCLYITTKKFMIILKDQQNKDKVKYVKDSDLLLLKKDDFSIAPVYVLTAYLFNPYSVLNCVAMTTTVFNNLFLSVSLLSMVSGNRIICCLAIAAAAHQALYPVLLIIPAAIFIQNNATGCAKCSYIKTLTAFVLAWGFLIYLSAYIMDGSYQFLENTYGFM